MVQQKQVTVYVGLGSNLGDRHRSLSFAVDSLDRHPAVQVDIEDGIASLYETSPVGGPGSQARYLNSALRLFTNLAPKKLLAVIMGVEQSMGRVRGERWGERIIDLDVLLVDDRVVDDKTLQVPHPRLHIRRFVLEPLKDIAPLLLHPVLGKTVAELADEARQIEIDQQVERVGKGKWFQEDSQRPAC